MEARLDLEEKGLDYKRNLMNFMMKICLLTLSLSVKKRKLIEQQPENSGVDDNLAIGIVD